MKEKRFFVVVFGDPEAGGDRVESGTYTARLGTPQFEVAAGDTLLLYCTGGYTQYPMQVPGLGKVESTEQAEIRYEWKPFREPTLRATILQGFEPEDTQKMNQLGFNIRRVFQISEQSFLSVVGVDLG